MYNLIRFLLHYWLFLFFLLLEAFCGFLIYKNSRFHQAIMFNKANEINGSVYTAYTNTAQYFSLANVNDSLAIENAKLHNQIADSYLLLKQDEVAVSQKDSTDTLARLQVYTYLPARVVKNSVNQSANYLYINKGSRYGITPQMGVISPNGVVGQVVSVTENYAAVMSILNQNFRLSAKLKNTRYFGQLSWEGKNTYEVQLQEIPKHVQVKVGDTIVTSGFSAMFPENIIIGRVTKVDAAPEKNFLEIKVHLSADMNNIEYVYVVNHLQRKELEVLDSITAVKPVKK